MLRIISKCAKAPIALAILFLLILLSGAATYATGPTGGLTVAPATITININAAAETRVAYVGVKNNFSQPVTLTAELKGVNTDLGILAPVKDLDPALAGLLSVSPATFSLGANESINLQINVQDGPGLGPGGSYAALVIKQANAVANNVGLQAAISASIFIIKEPGAQRHLDVTSLKIHRTLWEMPGRADVTFFNSGNVLALSRGILTIGNKDLTATYQKGIINDGSLTVFPGKQLTVTVPIRQLVKRWLPGQQTLTVQYRADGDGTIKTYQTTIFYIPAVYFLIIPVIAVGSWWLIKRSRRPKRRSHKIPIVRPRPQPAPKITKPVKKIIVTGDN